MIRQCVRSSLDKRSCLVHLLLHVLVVSADIVAGQRFDSAHARCDAVLGQDLELADLAGVLYMRAAAELGGELAHLDDADFVAVFLAEQRHGAALLGILNAHDCGLDVKTFGNLLVYEIFHSLDLFRRHRLEVAEVKSGAVGILVGSLLLDVCAQNDAQCLLHEVGRAVVSAGVAAVLRVDLESDHVAHLEHAACHYADVRDLGTCHMLGLLDLEGALSADDLADIADLSAHGAVERCFLCDDRGAHAVGHSLGHLIGLLVRFVVELRQRDDLAVLDQLVIAVEFRALGSVHLIVNGRLFAAHGSLDPAALGSLAGLCSRLLKSVDVDVKSVLDQHVLRGVDRESVCIVEEESVVAGQLFFALCAELLHHACQNIETLVDGLSKSLFLDGQVLEDEDLLLLQLGIAVFGALDDRLSELCHEGALDAELSALTDGAADQTAKDVASALIAGHDTVGDHEGRGADVVRDDTDGDIGLVVLSVLAAGQCADFVSERADCVHVEERSDVLNRHCQTLKAHTCVDIFVLELCVIAVSVIVELGEYDVPDFHEAVAFAAHDVLGTVTPFLAAVIVDLGAGAAGA